jgi:iron complex outermembrane receptor protein
MQRELYSLLFMACVFLCPVPASAQPTNLANLDLEDLMDIEVTSVSRKEERVIAAPAAVYVLTDEDIRRSGYTSIPELLRLVPGMHVAKSNSSTWAISTRGFSDVFANKLLVMIDGRTVYSPIFSGTYWDVQDYVLEDIERIEVVRGPGGTLWGGNAVNGVVNIITKKAKKTEGGLVSGSLGSSDRTQNSVRYGGALSKDASYRLYAKYREFDELDAVGGGDSFDDWYTMQSGFRFDIATSKATDVSLQGDVYAGSQQLGGVAYTDISPYTELFETNSDSSGGNILGKISHEFSADSTMQLQMFFDRTNRASFRGGTHSTTYDLDLQHQYAFSKRNEFVYGFGLRVLDDEFYSDGSFSADPRVRVYEKTNTFIQNGYELLPEELKLVTGVKIEHNEFTGAELQPNVRLQWLIEPKLSVWGAVSRAVRTPSRFEHDLGVDIVGFDPGMGLPGVARLVPNKEMDSEELLAYEIGMKAYPGSNLSFDAVIFLNRYDKVNTFDYRETFFDGSSVVQPIVVGNNSEARTYGGELSFDWHAHSRLRFIGTYSYIANNVVATADAADIDIELRQDYNPAHQLTLRTQINLGANWELDPIVRYVDTIAGLAIDSYIELDLRLGYRPSSEWEFALVGQNLLHESRQEFSNNPNGIYAGELERAVLGKVTWRF